MTRNSDVFIPLGRRVAIANSYRNAIFVSVHFNSARRSGANGIETYYYRRDSASLAAAIHRNVLSGAPTENRGIRRRGFWVLRKTAIPSVLVECGFLTNPTEVRYCMNPSYRQRLAENIARGIARQPAPVSRPLARGAASSPDVLQPFLTGSDVVRSEPRKKRKRLKKKSTKSRKKKKSSSLNPAPAQLQIS
jgi:hypothetical protein